MRNKIKQAFDPICADDNLKNHTIDYIQKKTSRRNSAFLRSLCAGCACFVIAAFGGYKLYFTTTSVISIDINPSIELDVNRFDKIISVDGYNQDGEDFSALLDIKYENYQTAIDAILESDTVENCLSENEFLTIAVLPLNEDQGENILHYVSDCTSQKKNMYCYSLNADEVSEAHSYGLSYGKYKAYLQLQALNIQITPEEISQMTMREIHELISQTSQSNSSDWKGKGQKGARFR